jgi:glycosyltransferase involved in cell wall biosynthesis
MKRVFFIAPLQLEDRSSPVFLAAHRKIFFLLQLLYELDYEVFFINSGPAMGVLSDKHRTKLAISDTLLIDCFTPATFTNIRFGRLQNIYNAGATFDWVVSEIGKPDWVWAYNGYAFEMCASRHAYNKYRVKTILEFEDWHFARSSVFNPKSFLDWLFWRRAMHCFSSAFVVNQFLAHKLQGLNIPISFLPSIVSDDVLALNENSPPFGGNPSSVVVCGYFGGLYAEKGVDFLIGLIEQSIENQLAINWVVTGSGPLSAQLESLCLRYPEIVSFLGTVTSDELTRQIGAVDVILNPHEPNHGVFPFKLTEAVASGRLVISSPVQLAEEVSWVGEGLLQLELEQSKWLEAIQGARKHYDRLQNGIEFACRIAKKELSLAGVSSRVKSALQ